MHVHTGMYVGVRGHLKSWLSSSTTWVGLVDQTQVFRPGNKSPHHWATSMDPYSCCCIKSLCSPGCPGAQYGDLRWFSDSQVLVLKGHGTMTSLHLPSFQATLGGWVFAAGWVLYPLKILRGFCSFVTHTLGSLFVWHLLPMEEVKLYSSHLTQPGMSALNSHQVETFPSGVQCPWQYIYQLGRNIQCP